MTTGNSVHRQILQVSFPRAVRRHPWIKVKEQYQNIYY